MDELKAERAKLKRLVTININTIRQLVAENKSSDIGKRVTDLKELFNNFTAVHHEYQETISDAPEAYVGCDEYFSVMQEHYIAVLSSVNARTVTDKHEPFQGAEVSYAQGRAGGVWW